MGNRTTDTSGQSAAAWAAPDSDVANRTVALAAMLPRDEPIASGMGGPDLDVADWAVDTARAPAR